MTRYKAILLIDKDDYTKGTEFELEVSKEYDDTGKWTGQFDYLGYFKNGKTFSGIHTLWVYPSEFQKSAPCSEEGLFIKKEGNKL